MTPPVHVVMSKIRESHVQQNSSHAEDRGYRSRGGTGRVRSQRTQARQSSSILRGQLEALEVLVPMQNKLSALSDDIQYCHRKLIKIDETLALLVLKTSHGSIYVLYRTLQCLSPMVSLISDHQTLMDMMRHVAVSVGRLYFRLACTVPCIIILQTSFEEHPRLLVPYHQLSLVRLVCIVVAVTAKYLHHLSLVIATTACLLQVHSLPR
jgi:hypothetical protein